MSMEYMSPAVMEQCSVKGCRPGSVSNELSSFCRRTAHAAARVMGSLRSGFERLAQNATITASPAKQSMSPQ